MDFRAKRVFFDRFSDRFFAGGVPGLSRPASPPRSGARSFRPGSFADRIGRHKDVRKFVSPITQSLQKVKACGVHNTNCAVSSSFWNIFRRVVKNAKFLDSIPKSASKRKVFGIFSEKCLDFLSFWIIFQIVTDA